MKRTRGARRIILLATPPILELDIVGPLTVFETANYLLAQRGQAPAYKVNVVTSAATKMVTGDCGLPVVASHRLNEVHGAIDTLLVAGGSGSLAVRPSHQVVKWLQRVATRVRRLGSICTGTFVLAAAGLLKGRRVATHWLYCQELRGRYGDLQVEEQPIFVRDGNIYTSAGVTAGIDLALELVEQDIGNTIALEVARGLVVFLRRPGGQAQFSVALAAQAPERYSLRELQHWITEHIDEPISVEQLAERVAMSPRNFARVFARELGVTPARYVMAQRVEAARRELERSRRSQAEIADRCGFANIEQLRRAFLRTVGVTPGRYREHFRHGRQKDF